MYGVYSVKILFESIVPPKISEEKIFEERIILMKAKNRAEIETLIKKKFPADRYENAEGSMTTNKLVQILDIFELVDDLKDDFNHQEVYSRYLLFEKEISAEQVIEEFKLDR